MNVVVGLGKTGFSCVKYCLRKGWPVAVTDSRDNPPYAEDLYKLNKDIQTKFGQFSEDLINNADQLIISPGVSLKEPVIANGIAKGIKCVGDIELFAREVSVPIIAITGSNGKSSVTSLLGEMFNQAGIRVLLGGNIGAPVLDFLDEPPVDLYILELSSFQLETTRSLKPIAATILNLSEDHMDRYINFSDYILAKQRIYHSCEYAIYNRFDKNTLPDCYMPTRKYISFGLDMPIEKEHFGLLIKKKGRFLAQGDMPLLNMDDMVLSRDHDLLNALAAMSLGYVVGLPMSVMIKAVMDFKGLPHRCQFVRYYKGATWYNDSKATNVGATIAALNSLVGLRPDIILIAGGLDKGADFSSLRDVVKRTVKQLIVFGSAADKLQAVLNGKTNIISVVDLSEAVLLAKDLVCEGDKVLLSPACSSFDMFDDYEHRGQCFIDCVNDL